MERLSGLDSAFLAMETPTMHLHVAVTAVIDPTTMTTPYSFTRLRSFIAGRLMAHPTFRRRVVEVPFGLNHALWVEDPELDLDAHISRHVLPAPGGARELADLTAAIVGVPLDRSRPLWEIHVVEGLHDGNVALIGKIHHAAVDGVSGAELFVHLFDLTPAPAARPTGPDADGSGVDEGGAEVGAAVTGPHPTAAHRLPSDIELIGHALVSQARRTLTLPRLLGRTARTATELVNRHRDPEATVGAVPLRAPRTPWSAAISSQRTVGFARVRLGDVKRVRAAFDVKVNDVVLAVVSGAARRYLAARDALPREPLVAMCPVSVRGGDERGRTDNRVSAMFVHLRTDVADVADRVAAIARTTRGAKADHNAVGATFLQSWADQVAPNAYALAARLYSRLNIADHHPPIYNVVVSNVPGPDFPLYLDGAALVATYPIGPIMEGAGLNVTVLSYLDNVDFGFLAGADLVPDVGDLADHVDDAMAELLAAADAVDPPATASATPAPAPSAAPSPRASEAPAPSAAPSPRASEAPAAPAAAGRQRRPRRGPARTTATVARAGSSADRFE